MDGTAAETEGDERQVMIINQNKEEDQTNTARRGQIN